MAGTFFESYVFSEVYKSYINAGKEPPILYYRDKDQKEIDILLYQNGILSPIEIKKAASPGKTICFPLMKKTGMYRFGLFKRLFRYFKTALSSIFDSAVLSSVLQHSLPRNQPMIIAF